MNRNGNDYWIKTVLCKLKGMQIQGSFIPDEEVRYVFLEGTPFKIYDKERVRDEDRALLYLLNMGVVQGERSTNEFRRQQLQGYRDVGPNHSVWMKEWDETDEAYRQYEWMTWLYGVNVDRFEKEIAKFNLVDNGLKLIDQKPKVETKLTTKNYDSTNGVLYINNGAVRIVKQKNRLSGKNESMQGRAMRLLFNDVNSMKNGISLRKISSFSSVVGQSLGRLQRASAKNQITEINNKIKPVTDGKKLIKIAKDICYIDPMYL